MNDILVCGGEYKHYKGGLYCVIGIGNHTETNETLVIYVSVHNQKPDFSMFYCRPYFMFIDKVRLPYTTEFIERFKPTGIIHLIVSKYSKKEE